MSLQQLSKEELREMSLIELGYQYLEQNKQALSFNELVEEIANLLGIPMEDMRSRMVQFYTDLNIDGRFISLGDNRWGLRIWYPYDQIDEEVVAPVKTKKKKSKKVVEEEDEDLLDDEDLDEDDEELIGEDDYDLGEDEEDDLDPEEEEEEK
ncbi:DNA-directed RNA polymerase subunit delta [Heyndrickxia sporothermodurans]|nr:DNA-directed RNA polymerase subunit delta [Heyndrickxia sporothermodurans]PTY83462.1 DNA-directed RNA polymerase subunit delta [Heyndrickxia sporothermodurans]